ncbi:MAG: hypothetical protein IJ797_03930 [Selenomonadaceae bacterium]|nr:hypothetical protein [Selenomonadaceae bacterium]
MDSVIKFRGKSSNPNTKGQWIFGGTIPQKSAIVDLIDHSPLLMPVDPNTVGRFTGYTDIDGNDVYEGDILLLADSDSNQRKGIVKFVYDCWYVHDIFSAKHKLFALFFVRTTMSAKVIGNIFDVNFDIRHATASSQNPP